MTIRRQRQKIAKAEFFDETTPSANYKNTDPIQEAFAVIENVKSQLQKVISEISGYDIKVQNIRPADKPRTANDLWIRFHLDSGTSVDLTKLRESFKEISHNNGAPRSIALTPSGYTVQMNLNCSKLLSYPPTTPPAYGQVLDLGLDL